MSVVGLSGAQGAGKSTLLEGLKGKGWRVDDFKVSRAVQAQLGWDSLQNVTTDPSTMQTFQEEVLKQKLQRDQQLREADGLVLTERTFADVCAYTTFWTWELVDARQWSFNEAARWLTDYSQRCVDAQKSCYDAVIMLPFMSHVVWQPDPNRADFRSVGTIWDSIESFTRRFELISIPTFYVRAASVEDRVAETHFFLENL